MGTRGGEGKVIVRPWLAGGMEKEVTLTEPWLQDSPHTNKVFTLAGFVSSARLTADQVRGQKEELREIILRLGGELVESDEWDERVTHVIAHVEGRRECMSEKVMAGLAAGRWVLTRRFLDKSQRKGTWVTNPGLFTVSETVSRHRKAWHLHGLQGSVFYGMKAALLISELRRAGVYKRIILSGGGKIFKCFSIRQLISKCPTKTQLTHVFLDPWVLLPNDPRHEDFNRLRQYCVIHKLDIKFLSYKFLFIKIRQFPEPPEIDYSIFDEKIQEMGLKEYQTQNQRDSLKRSGNLSTLEEGSKKMRSDVVTLDSSDEEEGQQARRSPDQDTSYVTQSEDLHGPAQTNGQERDKSEVNVTDSSSVQSFSAVDLEDEDDDDIFVLEQKLALSWQEGGGGGKYLEREKAQAPGNQLIAEKRPSIYIPSQRDEYLRRSKVRTEEPVETVTLDSESDQEDQRDTCQMKKGRLSKTHTKHRTSLPQLTPEGKKALDNAPNIVIIDDEDDNEIVEVSKNDETELGSAMNADLKIGLGEAQIKVLTLKDSVRRIEQTAAPVVRSQREEFILAAAKAAEEEKTLKLLTEVEIEFKIEDKRNQTNQKIEEEGKPEIPMAPAPTSDGLGEVFPQETDFSDVIEFEKNFDDQKADRLVEDDFDDESDFEINTSKEEEEDNSQKEDIVLNEIRLPAKNPMEKFCTRVNIQRLPNRVYLHYKGLLGECLSSKHQASAPDTKQKILVSRSTIKKQSSSLLHRILSTLRKRFETTCELQSLGVTSHPTPLQYDTHEESPSQTSSQLAFVRQSLDLRLLVDARNQCQEEDSDQKDNNDDIREFNTLRTLDSVSFLNRLKLETNSGRFLTSKMLNTVWKRCLLEESCDSVRETALDYLDHLLFFVSSNNRDAWLTVALSAFRDLKDDRLFKTFDWSNPQELILCNEFWKDICDQVIQNSTFSCCLWEDNTDDIRPYLGPYLLLKFLVRMMEKDMEIWWKNVEDSNLTSDAKFNYPVLFYILGGTMKDLLKNFSKTVLCLYKQFLKFDHELTEVRKLLGICAFCLSHLDLRDDYGSLYGGFKRSLAEMIADVYIEVCLPATSLYTELSLLSPSWLSVLVSHRLMTRTSRQFDKVTDISSLRSKFSSLSQSEDVSLLLVIDNFTHKLIGYQQVHSIFRAYWHYYKNVNSDFLTFKQLSYLEETGNKEKILKFGNILFHLTSLTETVALLTEFANGKLSFQSTIDSSGFDEIGALRALMFPMTSCYEF